MLENVQFVNPQFFWLFLLFPILIVWYIFKRKKQTATLKISTIKGFKAHTSFLTQLKPVLFVLRMLALAALITAMARPQTQDVSTKTKTTRGIDIVIAMDLSSSMLARDLKPNRLSALKTVAAQFIEERPNDRIGLVVYAGESYTKTPVTSDKAIVLNSLEDIKNGQIEDGTAIGMGFRSSSKPFKRQQSKK